MRVRFQADADLNHTIVLAVLRAEPAVDFQSAVEAELAGLDDPAVLARAGADGRLLVTHDRKTMPRHFADFVRREVSGGVVIIPQRLPVGQVVEELLLIWSATDAEEWQNQIASLPL